jgi:nucleoside-diphosphate-sugar epimerase
VAVTGASGFIGRRLLHVLKQNGHGVRALARGEPPANAPPEVAWVRGDLQDRAALESLVAGADTVIHLAGAIKALSQWEFMATNAGGTATLAEIACGQPTPPRFIQVSSLAAREPGLSPYAASKAAGEDALHPFAGRLPSVVIRPPAVYGPGDPETLRIFRMAARGFLPVPPNPAARLSLAHVDDAVAAILCVKNLPELPDRPIEFDDGAARGYTWAEVAAAAARAVGRPVRTVAVPAEILYTIGFVSNLVAQMSGQPTVLTHQKVAEIIHPDWVARTSPLPGYTPAWSLPDGFKNTAKWADTRGLVRILQLS